MTANRGLNMLYSVLRPIIHVTAAQVGSFQEVAACGTAVVLTPIQSLQRHDTGEKVEFGDFAQLQLMYDRVRAIQLGEYEDTHGWMVKIA
jgi:branched-chain amino acid aminotransferase